MRRILTTAILALVTAVGLVSVSSPVSAAPGIGYTQVDVDPAVAALLGEAGITPEPLGPATAFEDKGTLAVRFPVTRVDFRTVSVKHSGGLRLSAEGARISLSRFVIDLSTKKVTAIVVANGTRVGRVEVFDLVKSRKPRLGPVGLALTGTAADALNSTFGVEAFAAGAVFGYATLVLEDSGSESSLARAATAVR